MTHVLPSYGSDRAVHVLGRDVCVKTVCENSIGISVPMPRNTA